MYTYYSGIDLGYSIKPTGRFSSSKEQFFVEFRISLSLEVFYDFLFEVLGLGLRAFRVDISTTDQFVTWNGSPFVEINISISSDRRNSID